MKDIVYYLFVVLCGLLVSALILWFFGIPINGFFIGYFCYFGGVMIGRIQGPTVKCPF